MKQKIKFKVLKQSAEVGGKYYGRIDNADPINAELTMQQIIDFKKLHNYSASQLAALMEEILQGAAELVARDGYPRNLSTLLKFEARIKGTFANSEATVTNQKVYVNPRLLKDIKVDIDKSNFEFNNENDSTAPRITSAAEEVSVFGWTPTGAFAVRSGGLVPTMRGPLTLAGVRLAPNGWTADCKLRVTVFRDGDLLCRLDDAAGAADVAMVKTTTPAVASLNTLTFNVDALNQGESENAWIPDGELVSPYAYTPLAGDELLFEFDRMLTDGSGTIVSTEHRVTLASD